MEALAKARGIAIGGFGCFEAFLGHRANGPQELLVGEGSRTDHPKANLYLGVGTAFAAKFSMYFHVRSHGFNLAFAGGG
jgi:hypothetical protein